MVQVLENAGNSVDDLMGQFNVGLIKILVKIDRGDVDHAERFFELEKRQAQKRFHPKLPVFFAPQEPCEQIRFVRSPHLGDGDDLGLFEGQAGDSFPPFDRHSCDRVNSIALRRANS